MWTKEEALRAIIEKLRIGPENVMITADQFRFWDATFLNIHKAIKFNVGKDILEPEVINLETKHVRGSTIILAVYCNFIYRS
ncbi:MAG: hypothetical protein NC898_04345 [Candidatus Omnitrophica bacterium]|nr:hypothetical protein [Candidatus Omnitrophota bacterium]MCM8793677.1 hypothetical protein [Candidatus Omnitrophota bacterium]